jgi:hypothetical protein
MQRRRKEVGERKIGWIIVVVAHVTLQCPQIEVDALAQAMAFHPDIMDVIGQALSAALDPKTDMETDC